MADNGYTTWLQELVERDVWRQMRRWVLKRTQNLLNGKVSVSDVIQSAYVAAYEKGQDCRATTNEGRDVWFQAIVRNKYRKTVKRFLSGKRSVSREHELVDEMGRGQEPYDIDIVRVEVVNMVRMMLDKLPPQHAEVLYLRFAEGLSREEIATQLQTSPGVVANRMRRAIERARTLLIDDSDNELSKRANS